MLIVVTEPCCNRKPFEEHKKDCYLKQQKREMDEFIKKLLRGFDKALTPQPPE